MFIPPLKNKRNRIIIVSPRQFGYQTDYLKYCEYLKNSNEVVFFTLDQGEKKISSNGVCVKYSKISSRFKLLGEICFILKVVLYIMTHRGEVMIAYGSHCSIYKRLLPWRKMVVNFRTVSVAYDPEQRKKENERFRKESLLFDRIIMISEEGASQIGFDKSKLAVVSLGADIISSTHKDFEPLRLLYVGTLYNRDIIKTIDGFYKFLSQMAVENIHYDIVGDGEERELLRNRIEELNIQQYVTLHGKKPYDELKYYFDKCNIGVSFIPITDWYEYQPPTKTFEYCLSGLFCIATATAANSRVINETNGILIQDTSDAFADALTEIYKNHSHINSNQIRLSMMQYTWPMIVNDQLIPALQWKKS